MKLTKDDEKFLKCSKYIRLVFPSVTNLLEVLSKKFYLFFYNDYSFILLPRTQESRDLIDDTFMYYSIGKQKVKKYAILNLPAIKCTIGIKTKQIDILIFDKLLATFFEREAHLEMFDGSVRNYKIIISNGKMYSVIPSGKIGVNNKIFPITEKIKLAIKNNDKLIGKDLLEILEKIV